jgi:alkanesulfonate monooxygenase SsuD/methylene tetrahydromethanopterin reductase-like flavin-dependent oxidoreductase (luciferase family)
MKIGIGLPTTIPGATAQEVLEWARRAEAAGFSTLGTIDRIVHQNYEPLVALGAAAAVTERIGLATTILLLPTRASAAVVAKQAATIQALSGGRLVLGVAVGARPDDFEAAGRPFADRGQRLDADLELLHRAWAGEPVAGAQLPVAPRTVRGRVPLLIGGQPQLAVPRAARWDAGYTIGGAPPEAAAGMVEAFRSAWQAAGGQGKPRIVALAYFSLGEQHVQESIHNLRSYYAFTGDWVEGIAMGAPRTPEAVRERVAAFEKAGLDELILDPTVSDLDQVDLLADAVL